jgi:hypothetical protein
VSADPFSPLTVEKRTATGVRLPTSEKGAALVYVVTSCVVSKYPKAPAIEFSLKFNKSFKYYDFSQNNEAFIANILNMCQNA